MSRAQNIQRAQGQLGSQVHCLEKGDGGETIRPLSLSHTHTHTHTPCMHANKVLENLPPRILTHSDWLTTCRDFSSGQIEQTPGTC